MADASPSSNSSPVVPPSPRIDTQAVLTQSPDSTSPSQSTLLSAPSGPTRTRSFSLLQNIGLPFSSRPTTLRTSTTQADLSSVASTHSTKKENSTDLPPEILTQIDTFIKQITAPTHPAPFTPDKISDLFQSFYSRTFNLLPSFLPSPSTSTINLQPLLTATEISDRKRVRGEAHIKRQLWEEEIEQRVTTTIYNRIFAPNASDDAERDLKLQGKLKALIVVGVGLEHLGVELSEREKELLKPSIEAVGRELHALDNVKSPREKLEILVGVHKILVDGLTFPPTVEGESATSSSADLLLPVLIYSIIQANVETLISNVMYIQRFRAESLLQGEASYCLTNLEAAISFLETVDLHALNLEPTAKPPHETTSPPPMVRSPSSSSSTPSISKGKRAPLTLDTADPLNALPPQQGLVRSFTEPLESSYKLLWSKIPYVEPPRTLDDVRKLISRPFSAEENGSATSSISEKEKTNELNKLIVGIGVEKHTPHPHPHPPTEEKSNIITSGFRTLGTSLSRPFASRTPPLQTNKPSTQPQPQREMQDMVSSSTTSQNNAVSGGGILSGTQSRQIIPPSDSFRQDGIGVRKIKRVDERFLESPAQDLRIGDVATVLSELRRVVLALDELGGFED